MHELFKFLFSFFFFLLMWPLYKNHQLAQREIYTVKKVNAVTVIYQLTDIYLA